MNQKVIHLAILFILGLISIFLIFFVKIDISSFKNEMNLIKESPFKFLYFFIFCIITAFVALPLGVFTKVLSGWLFGLMNGSIFSILGLTLGSFFSYKLAQRTEIKISKLKNARLIHKIDQSLSQNGLLTVIQIRLFPFFPIQASNYLLGFTQVSDLNFFLGTLIGVIPASIFYSWIGSSIDDFINYKIENKILLLYSFFVLLVVLLLFKFNFTIKNKIESALFQFFKTKK